MQPSSFLKFALLALLSVPVASAQPVVTQQMRARELRDGTALEARALLSYIEQMIEVRALAGEDRAELEARQLPIIAGLKVLGKGVKIVEGLFHHKSKSDSSKKN